MSQTLYLAGPLFSESERSYNLSLAIRLEALGITVFLPQRDGVEATKPPYDTMTKDARRVATFTLDRDKIVASDIFLFVLDGRVPDEGACVELGIAYTDRYLSKKQRRIVGLQTDVRAAFLGAKLNPMLRVPLDFVADNQANLESYLRKVKE